MTTGGEVGASLISARRWKTTKDNDVGTFEEWCGNELSDHVPLVVGMKLGGETTK